MAAPIIINLEGSDGVGKNSIAKELTRIMKRSYNGARLGSFPVYDIPTGQMVKRFLMGELGNSPIKTDPYMASVLYATDRLQFYYDNINWFHKYDYIIFDRSWMSNLFYQGAKVLFGSTGLFDDGTIYLGRFLTYNDAKEAISKLNPTIKAALKCKAIIWDNEDLQVLDQFERFGNTWTYRVIHVWNTAKFQQGTPNPLDDYIRWLYNLEVQQSPLSRCKQQYYFITRDEVSAKVIEETNTSMKSRATLDIHEKSNVYRQVVQDFTEMLISPLGRVHIENTGLIPDVHSFKVPYVSGDPNDKKVQKQIRDVTIKSAIALEELIRVHQKAANHE